MDETFESLPPYPGVPFSTSNAAPPPYAGASPSAPPLPPPPSHSRRRWMGAALGGGVVLLAVGAFLLGHSTARTSPAAPVDATTLNALTSATSAAATPACSGPRRGTVGTLATNVGGTLTVTTPKGPSATVKTDGNTKVTKVVKGSLHDVTVGATVAVHGTASGTMGVAADHVAVLPTSASGTPGAPGGRGGFGPKAQAAGFATGTVQSVSSSGFTVSSGGSTITVTLSPTTVFAKTVPATIGELTVGQPIIVGGTPNSDGSISATHIEQVDPSLGKLPFGLAPGAPGAPGGTGGGRHFLPAAGTGSG